MSRSSEGIREVSSRHQVPSVQSKCMNARSLNLVRIFGFRYEKPLCMAELSPGLVVLDAVSDTISSMYSGHWCVYERDALSRNVCILDAYRLTGSQCRFFIAGQILSSLKNFETSLGGPLFLAHC